MTESNEVVSKYADVPLVFSHYYKYTFYFRGKADDGVEIIASLGGAAEEIYKEEVFGCEVRRLGDDWQSEWSSVSIYENGKCSFSWAYN